MISRTEAIKYLFDRHGEYSIYITSTGYISRAVYKQYPNRRDIFYMQGSMGIAPCIGLGVALNTDKEIVVISGDAALLMHLGITHTIRDAELDNLYLYVLDNGCHESVGGYQCSPLQSSYPGVHEVIKITKDGKDDRVGIDCIKNKDNIKELLNAI